MKILVVDDSKLSRTITMNALVNLGHQVISASSGEEAISLFKTENVDLILLDVIMDGLSGFECATALRAIKEKEWIPIIFLSSAIDDESIAKAIDAGGDDYLSKPFSKITLSAKIKSMERIAEMRHQLIKISEKLETLSVTDSLTGLCNRMQFDKTLKDVIAQANRHHHMAALMFIDIDHFKEVNDSLGHPTGDSLLKEISKRLSSCIRTNDFIARIGGDEFAIILREISSIQIAEDVAKKIINAFIPIFSIEHFNLNITSSIGVSCYPSDGDDSTELMKNADSAMYIAKQLGRNQYSVYQQTDVIKKS